MTNSWYKHGLRLVQEPTPLGTFTFNFGTVPRFLVHSRSTLVHGTDTPFSIFPGTHYFGVDADDSHAEGQQSIGCIIARIFGKARAIR